MDATLEAADAITTEIKDTASKIKDLVKAQKVKLHDEFRSILQAINTTEKSLHVLEYIKRITDEEKVAEEKAKATPDKAAPKEEATKTKDVTSSKIMGKHERALSSAQKNLRRALAD
ncbi:MAG: hypothetical protein UU47_C0003G0024 [candidate division TM6 bacterium GW2011_GWE2_41_16]|nr:MAG: hypothetical protein UU47_C0003G0024 [candidate division TM6 bacterium GW2011_GWE2_41_16]